MAKNSLFKVAGVIRQDSGVGFYRQVQPIRFLESEKLIKHGAITPFSGNHIFGENKEAHLELNDRMWQIVCRNSDVIWTNHVVNPDDLIKLLDLRHFYKSKLVIDMDDNLYAVSRDNPGEAKSKLLRKNLELCLSIADGLTVSVPALKSVYEPLNKNIFVNKNGVDVKLLDDIRENNKPNHKNRKIRIGWRGAYGHKADLESIYPALEALKKDYNIEVIIFGVSPTEGLKEPPFPVTWEKWVNLCDEDKDIKAEPTYPYYEKLARMNLDIAVVPLIDSSYNRCKSNINILEMGMMKYPVVASPVENQKNMPVLYARNSHEWYENIETLIKSAELRKSSGEELHKYITKNFDMKDSVKPLANWFADLPRRTDLEP